VRKPLVSILIPAYNSSDWIAETLQSAVEQTWPNKEIIVVDDGSADDTAEQAATTGVRVLRRAKNQGYGAALLLGIDYAIENQYDVLVTIDCDGQHEPQRIGQLVARCGDADIVSGSRYLCTKEVARQAPAERRQINIQITRELNERLGLSLTDAFCGFKAYRVSACRRLKLAVDGYDFPMQFWVQAARLGLRVKEVGVPRLYLDPNRAFGGVMNDPEQRLAYYRAVMAAAELDVLPAVRASSCCGCPGAC